MSTYISKFALRNHPRRVELVASALVLGALAAGCGAADDLGAADGADDGDSVTSAEEARRRPRSGSSASAPASASAAPTPPPGTVIQIGSVWIDEHGNITLMPNAFAPNDDGSDAVGGPSDDVGTPGALSPQEGGTCPGNVAPSGACAHYGDQCVYAASNGTGYCTCIQSTPSTPGTLGWSCH